MNYNSKVVLFLIAVLVIYTIYKNKNKNKSERDVRIDMAIKNIHGIKMKHHAIIVDALDKGASPSDHETLLESKRIEVIAAMEAAELSLDIVIEKSNPTIPGPVVVLDRRNDIN